MPPFVALQDRFVNSLAVACCPTMDLIAVLTLDHHLLVHRTTSWQKLLHIKPSNVGFDMVALAWKPNGLQLAVGGDEGNVAIFDMESGETLPERRSNLCHKSCITAMNWIHVDVLGGSVHSNQGCRQSDGVSSGTRSHSDCWFRHRSARFLKRFQNASEFDNTVLVTADERGFFALWWMGRVLLTRIDVCKHFTEEESKMMETMGFQRGDCRGFRIEQIHLAPDFSVLIILLSFGMEKTQAKDAAIQNQAETKVQRLLTLNMVAIQSIYEEVTFVASTIDHTHGIVNQIASISRQMVTEWKNAMRLFELKMGLMGSLYEKYACEDLPQVDMLTTLVTGITAPALAQYFAQDIQEMSVHRMQKALFTGCETLRGLVGENMKSDLVDFLFLVSELRGHLSWNPQTYTKAMGITVAALDDLVKITQDLLVEMEALTLALHETRQDFALFFQWILERIRIHSNTFQSGGNSSDSARDKGGTNQNTKSLLDLRRLCDFLDHAARFAKDFHAQQPHNSVYTVETTFGNSVSQQLSTRPNSLTDNSSNSCLFLIQNLHEKWSTILDAIGNTLTLSVVRESSGCFTVGTSSIEECHVCFRQPFSSKKLIKADNTGDQSENEESDDEAIDWHALKHYGPMHDTFDSRSTILIGFRLQSGNLLLLNAARDRSFHLQWKTALVRFSHASSGSLGCQGFAFYGDASRKRTERLAFVVDRMCENQVLEEWLFLEQYDHISFSYFNPTASLEAIIACVPNHAFQIDQIQGRKVASLPLSLQSSKRASSVIATASRGILCVTFQTGRLTVYDAEDSEDEEDETSDN